MEPILSPENNESARVNYPDARQTRIDFFRSSRKQGAAHITPSRKGGREWWQAITGWLSSSKHEQEHQLDEFRKFLEQKLYSEKTIASYFFMLRKFFAYLDEKEIRELTYGDIEDYNYDFFVSGSYSRSYQLQFINGLSLYIEFAHGVKLNLKSLRRTRSSR